jgi:hypothetical protein
MYDGLVRRLFQPRLHLADEFYICFSKRGKSDRTAAMKKAIQDAVHQLETDSGVRNRARIEVVSSSPPGNGGLQAADYFLWALQRFYEHEHTESRDSESRYVQMLWPLGGQIDDLDFLWEGKRGVSWGAKRPLTLEARTAVTSKKKKPGI